jgi:hypothetical protein
MKRMPEGTVRPEFAWETNGFTISSGDFGQVDVDLKPKGGPDGNATADFKLSGETYQIVFVSAPGMFTVGVEKGRSAFPGGGLVITHRETGEVVLTVSDADGDGRLDGLRYSKVDDQDRAVLEVEDYDVDGQPDFRRDFTTRARGDLWHKGRWYPLERRDEMDGIVVDGRFLEVRKKQGRHYVYGGDVPVPPALSAP